MSISDVGMLFQFIGGLGMFLYGMGEMADGLQRSAGHRMQRLLGVLTNNRLLGVLVGAAVTAIIQSSSATTVMVVGFVNAGIINLTQAVGIIMGANIGTTVTSWIVSMSEWGEALKPEFFAPLLFGIGAVMVLFMKNHRKKDAGEILIGFALLFIGLSFMSSSIKPYRDAEIFSTAFMVLGSNPILGILTGAVVTAIIQSSSASVGILQTLALNGIVNWQSAIFITLGQNIGTCVTALLASVGANRTAKRAAVVHLLFNIIGATLFIIIALALPLASWIEMLAGANLRLQIAFAHIIFNVVTTLLLLPLSGLLEKLAYLVVRGEDKQEEPMRLEYFDTRLFSTPPVAVQQLFREVQRMADIVTANYRFAMQYYFAPKDLSVDEFDNNEQVIDYLNAEITQNLIELKGLNLRSEDIRLVGSLFHVVNDLERIGDHSMNIVEIGSARKKEKLRFSGKAEREIEELSGIVTSMLDKSIHIVRQQITDVEIIGEVIELESQVDKLCETLADHHVERVKNKKCTPRNGMLYLDMLNNLERIADHADNLASSVEPDHHDNRLLW